MIIRHLKILEFALSSLVRRTGKNLAIICVFAFTIAVLASVLFLTNALKIEAKKILAHAPNLLVQKIVGGRHDLIPLSYIQKIAKIPGVGEVSPRVWGYYYDTLWKSNYTLMSHRLSSDELPFLEGNLPLNDDQCAIGKGVATMRDVQMGDDLILVDSTNLGKSYEITGIFQSQSNILTNDLILFSGDSLRNFFAIPANKATDFSVQVYNENEVDNIARKIKEIFPDTRPITKREILRTYDTVFNWRSGMMLTLFASALIAFCILAWDKATGISSEEKTEIAILKAIGWDVGDILELKFWEGLILSLTSLLIGLIGAIIHVFFFNGTLLSPVIKGWSTMFPRFDVMPYIDMYQVFVISFLTITPYIVCTIVPSWKTAITDPDQVMRG